MPVPAGFSGFNTYMLNAISYGDTRFQSFAAAATPGWLRYPAGTEDDTFDWASGLEFLPAQLPAGDYDPKIGGLLLGLGGKQLEDLDGGTNGFMNLFNASGAKGIVIVVNGFTDTPDSAAGLAQFVVDNHLPVIAFELSNEPYLFPGFWGGGGDYASSMQPYYAKITQVIPDATVSLFVGPGDDFVAWNGSLTEGGQYWNAASYHDYPSSGRSDAGFSTRMVNLDSHLVGLAATFGALYFLSAQVVGFGVANEALIHATSADSTVVDGGETLVTPPGSILALFAQAYEGDDGNRHLVITNKGDSAEAVLILEGTTPVASPLQASVAGSLDGGRPDTRNVGPGGSVARSTETAGNPVAVPPYSVVHVWWSP